MEHNNFSQFHSELSLSPDLPILAERCKLLTEILLDCKSPPQTQPVCRCLSAYLEEVKTGLTESRRDFQIVEFDDEAEQPGINPCSAGFAPGLRYAAAPDGITA